MHVHGGGGASYLMPTRSPRPQRFHLRHGTTTTLASLVTAVARRTARRRTRTRRGDPRGHHRGHPSGGAVAEPGALRRARPHPDARSRPRRDRRRAGRRRRRDPDGHAGTRTARKRRRRSGVLSTRVSLSPLDIPMRPTSRPNTPSPWARRSAPICSTRCRRCTTASRDPRSRCCRTRGHRRAHRRRRARAPGGRGGGDPGRRTDRVAVITDAIAAAGCGDGAFQLGAVSDRRGVRGGAGARDVDDRRQHRHHGSALPQRSRSRPDRRRRAGRRGADDLGNAGAGARPRAAWAACGRVADANLVVLDRRFAGNRRHGARRLAGGRLADAVMSRCRAAAASYM